MADKPGECKSDYPRTSWLSHEAFILCPCQLEARGFAQHGRKNRLCSLQGPYGHEYLNGCHPALLRGIRGGNIDVQIPYRLPYACKNCGKRAECLSEARSGCSSSTRTGCSNRILLRLLRKKSANGLPRDPRISKRSLPIAQRYPAKRRFPRQSWQKTCNAHYERRVLEGNRTRSSRMLQFACKSSGSMPCRSRTRVLFESNFISGCDIFEHGSTLGRQRRQRSPNHCMA